MTSQPNFDMVEFVNRRLEAEHPPEPLRWVECDECGGTGGGTSFSGEVPNSGMGPTHVPGQVEWECPHCSYGYVKVDEGDYRWKDGTFAHPDDRGR